MIPSFAPRRAFQLVLALALATLPALAACGASTLGAARRAEAPRPVPPDVRGEPLALLPHEPLAYLRVDAAAVRASPHYGVVRPMLEREAAADLAALDRELGFDPIASADVVAAALYAPTGGAAGADARGWPVLYARGAIDRDAILAAARARATPADPLRERTDDGVAYYATRARAYYFPAPDVVFVFEPALTGRLLRRLAGVETRSAVRDARFDPLWESAGGFAGAVRVAADATALRAAGQVAGMNAGDAAGSVERFVLRADAPAAVTARAIAVATSEQAAAAIVASVEETRRGLLDRWEVRLLGLSRLLQQGVTAVHEERTVRLALDARADEASRVLRATQLLQVFAP